jgi:prepilin-type N-terminal cleavage/methylation domain-containing protein
MRGFKLRKRAFTITELMVVTLIFAIFLMALFALLRGGRRLWQTDSVLGEIQAKARNGMEFMSKELQGAKIVSPDIGTSASALTFQLPASVVSGDITWSSNIQYSVNASSQLIRSKSGESDKVIANNVYSATFNRPNSDSVTISLTLQKYTITRDPINITLSTQATLRN